MSIFVSAIYGFVSGITEILPVSSQAHQAMMCYLFGVETRVPLQEFLVHIGILLSLIFGCSEILGKLLREQRIIKKMKRRKIRYTDSKTRYDLRLLRSASVLLFIGLFFYYRTKKFENGLLYIMAFWFANAIILLIVEHLPRGNRDSRTMSSLDGIVMGIVGALSVFPGISRTSTISAYAISRGVDNENTANWSLLLGIPAMLFFSLHDFLGVFNNGTGVHTMAGTISCAISGAAAFAGGYLGVTLLKVILHHSGFSKFSYYNIGAAMFTFAIYLITW